MIQIKHIIEKGQKKAILNTSLPSDDYDIIRITTNQEVGIKSALLSDKELYIFLFEEAQDDIDFVIDLVEKVEFISETEEE